MRSPLPAAVQEPRATPIEVFGLRFGTAFLRDRLFIAALLAAPVAIGALGVLSPQDLAPAPPTIAVVLIAVLWQPVVEELLFRGIVQGKLSALRPGRARVAGISGANAVATLMFALAHLFHHPLGHAASVALPSLLFGFLRDRHGHILSPVCLHSVYNACYLLLGPWLRWPV